MKSYIIYHLSNFFIKILVKGTNFIEVEGNYLLMKKDSNMMLISIMTSRKTVSLFWKNQFQEIKRYLKNKLILSYFIYLSKIFEIM